MAFWFGLPHINVICMPTANLQPFKEKMRQKNTLFDPISDFILFYIIPNRSFSDKNKPLAQNNNPKATATTNLRKIQI